MLRRSCSRISNFSLSLELLLFDFLPLVMLAYLINSRVGSFFYCLRCSPLHFNHQNFCSLYFLFLIIIILVHFVVIRPLTYNDFDICYEVSRIWQQIQSHLQLENKQQIQSHLQLENKKVSNILKTLGLNKKFRE